MGEIDEERLAEQERTFARAFAAGDPELARELYCRDVVYLSPTVRLFDWPAKILGVDETLRFIRLTIQGLSGIRYQAVERAVLPDGDSAFVRIHFDFDSGAARLRSNYVVLYRYRGGRIRQQELFYDPGGRLERLGGGSPA